MDIGILLIVLGVIIGVLLHQGLGIVTALIGVLLLVLPHLKT